MPRRQICTPVTLHHYDLVIGECRLGSWKRSRSKSKEIPAALWPNGRIRGCRCAHPAWIWRIFMSRNNVTRKIRVIMQMLRAHLLREEHATRDVTFGPFCTASSSQVIFSPHVFTGALVLLSWSVTHATQSDRSSLFQQRIVTLHTRNWKQILFISSAVGISTLKFIWSPFQTDGPCRSTSSREVIPPVEPENLQNVNTGRHYRALCKF
jgi:hypothetical protein